MQQIEIRHRSTRRPSNAATAFREFDNRWLTCVISTVSVLRWNPDMYRIIAKSAEKMDHFLKGVLAPRPEQDNTFPSASRHETPTFVSERFKTEKLAARLSNPRDPVFSLRQDY